MASFTQDHYTILQVSENATLETIKASYDRLSLQLRPASNPTNDTIQHIRAVEKAFWTLRYPQIREIYDLERRNAKAKTAYQPVAPPAPTDETHWTLVPASQQLECQIRDLEYTLLHDFADLYARWVPLAKRMVALLGEDTYLQDKIQNLMRSIHSNFGSTVQTEVPGRNPTPREQAAQMTKVRREFYARKAVLGYRKRRDALEAERRDLEDGLEGLKSEKKMILARKKMGEQKLQMLRDRYEMEKREAEAVAIARRLSGGPMDQDPAIFMGDEHEAGETGTPRGHFGDAATRDQAIADGKKPAGEVSATSSTPRSILEEAIACEWKGKPWDRIQEQMLRDAAAMNKDFDPR